MKTPKVPARVWVILAVSAALASRGAPACTTVLLEHGADVVVAKSYDYFMGQGLLLVNPRGLRKSALPGGVRSRGPMWVARYGSVTFNQYGRELPTSGMNEAGLVIEVMWLDETRVEEPDARPALLELQWLQYQLDTRGNVAELVAHVGEVRVAASSARVHYLACDRSGACAAVEYLDGALVVTTGDTMPVRALTNDTYAASCAYLRGHSGFGGQQPPRAGAASLDRFVRASDLARRAATEDRGAPGLTDDAFTLLDAVSQGASSVWNLVWDPIRLVVHYRTHANPRVKRLNFAGLNLACDAGAKMLDIDAERWGDVTSSLHPYSLSANRALVARSFAKHFATLPAGAADIIARAPEGFHCEASQP